ncbi:MAG: TorF family putative porin [Thioalkalispiraceae bacterium]|jgi:uncharacterized protein (TIGR02001 family)
MNKNKIAIASAALLTAMTGSAQAETSANVAVTTDYVFRGISQSDGAPAIQGGVDYAHQSGFAAGVWASSVDDTVGDAGIEVDLYATFSATVGEYGYSVGYYNYRYPGGDSGSSEDVAEIALGGTFRNYALTYYKGDSDLDADYLEFKANFAMDRGVNLGIGVGRTFDDNGEDITDFKLGVSTQIEGLDFELAYTDNNSDNPAEQYDSRVFLTVSKSM